MKTMDWAEVAENLISQGEASLAGDGVVVLNPTSRLRRLLKEIDNLEYAANTSLYYCKKFAVEVAVQSGIAGKLAFSFKEGEVMIGHGGEACD